MLPSIKTSMAAHRLADVTPEADADMVSAANHRAIEAEGHSFILGAHPDDLRQALDRIHHAGAH